MPIFRGLSTENPLTYRHFNDRAEMKECQKFHRNCFSGRLEISIPTRWSCSFWSCLLTLHGWVIYGYKYSAFDFCCSVTVVDIIACTTLEPLSIFYMNFMKDHVLASRFLRSAPAYLLLSNKTDIKMATSIRCVYKQLSFVNYCVSMPILGSCSMWRRSVYDKFIHMFPYICNVKSVSLVWI